MSTEMSSSSTSSSSSEVDKIVREQSLLPHPEGGFFKQWYAAEATMSHDLDATRWKQGVDKRSLCTAITYLCTGGSKSSLHRIKSDELWVFQAGGPLVVVELLEEGGTARVKETLLGVNGIINYVVKGGTYFGAYCPKDTGYSLVCCVVAPGFDYHDWEMASKEELNKLYPSSECSAMIEKLSKDS